MIDLRRYRWHVGADVRPLAPKERAPVLFRDVGPAASAAFVRGRLKTLTNRSPVAYFRDASWREPYVDYEQIGWLVLLRPDVLRPWATGVPGVWVTSAEGVPNHTVLGFVPGPASLLEMSAALADVTTPEHVREVLGGPAHDGAVAESVHRAEVLERELAASEIRVVPIRRALQSGSTAERDKVRAWMADRGVTEADVCSAWHHLPPERRRWLMEHLTGAP